MASSLVPMEPHNSYPGQIFLLWFLSATSRTLTRLTPPTPGGAAKRDLLQLLLPPVPAKPAKGRLPQGAGGGRPPSQRLGTEAHPAPASWTGWGFWIRIFRRLCASSSSLPSSLLPSLLPPLPLPSPFLQLTPPPCTLHTHSDPADHLPGGQAPSSPSDHCDRGSAPPPDPLPSSDLPSSLKSSCPAAPLDAAPVLQATIRQRPGQRHVLGDRKGSGT